MKRSGLGLGAAAEQHERWWDQRLAEDVAPRVAELRAVSGRNGCTSARVGTRLAELVARAESARVHFQSMPKKWQAANAGKLAEMNRGVQAAVANLRDVCFPKRVQVEEVGLAMPRLAAQARAAQKLAWHRYQQGDCAAAASLIGTSVATARAYSALKEAFGEGRATIEQVLPNPRFTGRTRDAYFPDVSECFAPAVPRPAGARGGGGIEMDGARRRRRRRGR
jgi:hypothetical protein